MHHLNLNRYLMPALLCGLVLLALWIGVDPAAASIMGLAAGNMEVKDLVPMLEDLQKNAKERFEKLAAVEERTIKLQTDLIEVQQKMDKARHGGGGYGADLENPVKGLVEQLTASDGFKAMARGTAKDCGITFSTTAVAQALAQKTAIVSSSTLVPRERTGMYGTPERATRIRDLLSKSNISSGAIEFVRYTVTNNADVQYSSPTGIDGAAKPESAMTFELVTRSAATIAHWVPASRQVLADAMGLQVLIETELLAGLGDVEDGELLLGDASGGHLDGLWHNATSYSRPGAVSSDTQVDTLRRAITQVRLARGRANAILLHPGDAEKIDLLKDSTGRYLQVVIAGRAWQIPVVETEEMSPTAFLVGDFERAAHLHIREEGTIRIAEQHSDYFTKNMIAILAEQREVLEIRRPAMLVRGNFN